MLDQRSTLNEADRLIALAVQQLEAAATVLNRMEANAKLYRALRKRTAHVAGVGLSIRMEVLRLDRGTHRR